MYTEPLVEISELQTQLVGVANNDNPSALAFCAARKLLAIAYQRWVLGAAEPCVQVFGFEKLKWLTPVCSMHESDVWHPIKFTFDDYSGYMAFSNSDAFPPVLFVTDNVAKAVHIIDVTTWQVVGRILRKKNDFGQYSVASMEDMVTVVTGNGTYLYRGSYASWTLEKIIRTAYCPYSHIFVRDNADNYWGFAMRPYHCVEEPTFVFQPVHCDDDFDTEHAVRLRPWRLCGSADSWSLILSESEPFIVDFDCSAFALCGVQCNRPVFLDMLVDVTGCYYRNVIWVADVGAIVCYGDLVRVFAAPNVFNISFMSPARAAWMCSVCRIQNVQ